MLQDTDTHGGQKVSSTVRVVINTAVKGRCHIFTERRLDVLFTTWMLLNKVLHIVKDAFQQDPLLVVVENEILEFVPGVDGQFFEGCTVLEPLLQSKQLLFLHLDPALGHFVRGERLEVIGETKEREELDKPFGGVILVEQDGVAVILRELMVEVVVSFTHRHKRSNPVVAWSVMVIEGVLTKEVSQTVDTERSMVNKDKTKNAGIKVSALNHYSSSVFFRLGRKKVNKQRYFTL